MCACVCSGEDRAAGEDAGEAGELQHAVRRPRAAQGRVPQAGGSAPARATLPGTGTHALTPSSGTHALTTSSQVRMHSLHPHRYACTHYIFTGTHALTISDLTLKNNNVY